MDLTLKHKILVLRSTSYPDPAFYLNADQGPKTVWVLVRLCHPKKLDIGMKNFFIKSWSGSGPGLDLYRVLSKIPGSGLDPKSAKQKLGSVDTDPKHWPKICLTPNVPFAVKLTGQPVHWNPLSTGSSWYSLRQPSSHSGVPVQLNRGIFLIFLYMLYSALLHLPPLRFHCVGEMLGIEPRTVVTSAFGC